VAELLDRLGEEEQQFLSREFLAPAIRGGSVRVRIGGVVCRIRISPKDFEGWGVFRPRSHTIAELVGPATLAQRRQYLDIFPLVRLIVCRRRGTRWLGSAASFGDRRFRIEGLVPIELAEEVQTFDVVRCRFDGATFWFDEIDSRHDAAAASYLRHALEQTVDPVSLGRPGLTAEQRAAYEVNYWERLRPGAGRRDARQQRRTGPRLGQPPEELSVDPVQARLRESLSHAGARLVDYLERSDSYRVTYSIGGQQYTSSVAKNDLTVQVAGICLSGQDRKFDLSSLVGVLREAGGGGEIVPVGDENDGMEEEDYWDAHPPRGR
jgi:hypothetical protein